MKAFWQKFLPLLLFLAALLPAGPALAAAYTYTGTWQNQTVSLTRVTNVTVEGLPDATLVGQLQNFETNDPSQNCLNGEALNVWMAPSEFPGEYVVHNGDQGTQCTYGTWTFPQAPAAQVAGYAINVSSPQTYGKPFTFTVTAVDANGNTVTSANGPVALSSSTNNVLFLNGQTGPGNPLTVNLVNGTATVKAVDNVPETTTITASANGVSGTSTLNVEKGLFQGVSLSINGGTPETVADIDFIDYTNGVNTSSQHGGFWPLGIGSTYGAVWTGTLHISTPGTYGFLNVADDTGTATITVNGQAETIPTNSWTQGSSSPLTLTLSAGDYPVTVSQQETDGQGGAGDTLKWQPPGASGLTPIPPAAFGEATATCSPAAFQVTAPSSVQAGIPFSIHIVAVDSSGNPAPCATGPVYLSSSDNNVLFVNGTFTKDGSTSIEIPLQDGSVTVIARDLVAGQVTVNVQDASGTITGSSSPITVNPPAQGGLSLQVWSGTMTPGSFNGGTPTAQYQVPYLDFLDYRNGLKTTTDLGGFWPLGTGTPYSAEWQGTLYIQPSVLLPSPLPHLTHVYRFRNVADDEGYALLSVVPGTGASITLMNGQTVDQVKIPTSSWQQGDGGYVQVKLTPGRYNVDVQQTEGDGLGGAGDTLYWSQERIFPVCQPGPGVICPLVSGQVIIGPEWSPFEPVPASAFQPGPVPLDHGIVLSVGHRTDYIDGDPHEAPVAPEIVDNRTFVPLREVGELLGATVHWNGSKKQVIIEMPGISCNSSGRCLIVLTVNSKTIEVNGTPEQIDVAPFIANPGYTYVPIRFISQALGLMVGWDQAAKEVIILKPGSSNLTTPGGSGSSSTSPAPAGPPEAPNTLQQGGLPGSD